MGLGVTSIPANQHNNLKYNSMLQHQSIHNTVHNIEIVYHKMLTRHNYNTAGIFGWFLTEDNSVSKSLFLT